MYIMDLVTLLSSKIGTPSPDLSIFSKTPGGGASSNFATKESTVTCSKIGRWHPDGLAYPLHEITFENQDLESLNQLPVSLLVWYRYGLFHFCVDCS